MGMEKRIPGLSALSEIEPKHVHAQDETNWGHCVHCGKPIAPSARPSAECVVVPIKPTKAMLNAAHRCQWADKYDDNPRLQPESVWAAMLAAAPVAVTPNRADTKGD